MATLRPSYLARKRARKTETTSWSAREAAAERPPCVRMRVPSSAASRPRSLRPHEGNRSPSGGQTGCRAACREQTAADVLEARKALLLFLSVRRVVYEKGPRHTRLRFCLSWEGHEHRDARVSPHRHTTTNQGGAYSQLYTLRRAWAGGGSCESLSSVSVVRAPRAPARGVGQYEEHPTRATYSRRSLGDGSNLSRIVSSHSRALRRPILGRTSRFANSVITVRPEIWGSKGFSSGSLDALSQVIMH